ncbi:MAG: MBOAT family O-acyltransferase [Bdellovibrionota bacterium]|nr:MBOAT family O-acyltransferase [Bdellovibrionota bacterium]
MIKKEWQSILLLFASYYFYMAWNPWFALLILFSTIIDFSIAKLIVKNNNLLKKRSLLLISLSVNLGLLFYFKYTNFFLASLHQLLGHSGEFKALDIILPVGISFYTFQTLSYTIDVYRGQKEVEDSFIKFSLYVSFFPQLVAGPIERSTHLLPQLEKFKYKYDDFIYGSKLIVWGFFKKLVIADRLAIYVNNTYSDVSSSSSLALIAATYFFSFQIFCDFSGYTDIARGISRLFGVDLMHNFKRPYFASSIAEFWKRWHISLSTWFRDYLYIPLGGSRTSQARWFLNILIVFLVSGLWHGANWTFVIWGALHALYFKVEKVLEIILPPKEDKKASRIFKIFFTYHLTLFAWIFFRANDLKHALKIIQKIISDFEISFPTLSNMILKFTFDNRSPSHFLLAVLAIAFLLIIQGIQERKKMVNLTNRQQFIFYAFLIIMTILFGNYTESSFIYFQF